MVNSDDTYAVQWYTETKDGKYYLPKMTGEWFIHSHNRSLNECLSIVDEYSYTVKGTLRTRYKVGIMSAYGEFYTQEQCLDMLKILENYVSDELILESDDEAN